MKILQFLTLTEVLFLTDENKIEIRKVIYPNIVSNIKINNYCYLLESLNSSSKKKYYFGYTTDPIRRLKQHNGLITGGAKKTRKNRPWGIVLTISGFITKNEALKYEYFIIKSLNKRRIFSLEKAYDFICKNIRTYEIKINL